MPFKFKLSKRLALIKASLAASVVLALACESDLTDPQPPRNPLTQVLASADLTPLRVASVVASGDDGNVPQNTLDNNLATRWSASGDGQWIRYDLGAVMAVGAVNIAWYRGTEWASAFDIEVSLDSLTWTRAFTGRSSGQTLQPERYDFPTVPGRYVRIVGHGQWSGTTQLSLWNSITETAIYGSAAVRVDSVPVASVTVSPASGSARIGATMQLSGVTKDSAGNLLTRRTVNWMTSNNAVATVSASGLVTGVAAGSATITATSDGQSGTAAMTVTNVPVARVTVTPLIASLLMGAAGQLTATPTDALGNPLSGRVVTWSSNAHVAAGNYTWSYSANRVTKSGTATALLTYISDTKWGAKIYGSDCSPITNDGDYVQIINFDVTGSCNQGITTNGNYSKIIGNRVHDMPGTALTGAIVGACCDYTITGIQIIGNVVDNIGPWGQVNQTHGIYVAGPYAVVENNIVTRAASACIRSEEHTSELQSLAYLVCRLLLEKKKNNKV